MAETDSEDGKTLINHYSLALFILEVTVLYVRGLVNWIDD